MVEDRKEDRKLALRGFEGHCDVVLEAASLVHADGGLLQTDACALNR